MISKCFVLCAVVVITVSARSASVAEENSIPNESAGRSEESFSLLGELRYAYNIYKQCEGEPSCLKLKLITALDRAARSLTDLSFWGISFTKIPDAPETPLPESEKEIEANLPRSLNDREEKLDGMIADRIGNFFQTHSVQLKLPTMAEIQSSFTEEGRAKKKKMSGLLTLPLILGGTLIPLVLGGLALLAGKALLTAKIALVLASIIAFKKLFGGSSPVPALYPHEGHEVVLPAGHATSGWGRSYHKDAPKLAYSAYAPKSK